MTPEQKTKRRKNFDIVMVVRGYEPIQDYCFREQQINDSRIPKTSPKFGFDVTGMILNNYINLRRK